MRRLLFEIGVEELPAAACIEAALQLPSLSLEHLGVKPTELFIGPRRLAFPARVPDRTEDEWVKGPPENLRDRAAAGFAKRYGVSVDELAVRDGFLGLEVPGRPIEDVLPERLAAIVTGLQFTKSMTWGAGFRFARPVRWLCAKLDAATVEVPLDGVPSGGVSYGHRATHPGPVEIESAESYLDTLRAAGVEPDRAVRYERIVAGLDALGSWSDPLGKLDEVVYLVEKADVLAGSFDERFLQLPERVVVTTMQSHQRYFPLGGNRFAFVANGGDPDVVRSGNEFVLSGRLEDAEFTFARDVAIGIDGLAERTKTITFFTGGGTFADKAERLATLVVSLGGGEAAVQAARLAKADQAAELVREFSELEGHIGATYAALAGYPRRRRAGDRRAVPAGQRGRAVATVLGRSGARSSRQARHIARRVRSRQATDRVTRPVRPAPSCDRALPARDRRRRAHRALAAARRRARLRRGAVRGPARPAGRIRPCRDGRRLPPISAASPGSPSSCTRPRTVTTSVRSTRRTTARNASPASATTRPPPSIQRSSSTTPSGNSPRRSTASSSIRTTCPLHSRRRLRWRRWSPGSSTM